ncbi:MAG: ABC transporter permease [Candidatus Bathyarchaeia archaeon]|nr:ABC transporter permease [Candidatus Bathyarchaeota archaeon]
MVRILLALMVKEVKELVRDPKILLGVILMPLILFPIMGSAIGVSQESAVRAASSSPIAIYNEDKGEASQSLIGFLEKNGTVIIFEASSLEEALTELDKGGYPALLHIPKGHSANITSGRKAMVRIYANLRDLTITETLGAEAAANIINIYSYQASLSRIERLLSEAGATYEAEAVRSPIAIHYSSLVRGSLIEAPPQSIIGLVISQSVLLPVLVMVMLMFAIQMAATSIAIEKEQKTFETLMTLPIGRLAILAGKLGGSIVVAILGSIAYMFGFSFYMGAALRFASQMPLPIGEVGLSPSPLGLLLLGCIIFITLVSGLALAISLAIFTDSVRAAQSLVGVLVIPVVVPAIILMFTGLENLPTGFRLILLMVPYTHSILSSKAALLGDYFRAVGGILYISIFTGIILYIASRLFSTERIITSRIGFRRSLRTQE